MRDKSYDPDETRTYECYECGKTVEARRPPGSCPRCGAEMRNRKYPIE